MKRTAELLEEYGCRLLRSSEVYETDPWGGALGNDFLNTVWELDFDGTPQQLLEVTQTVERELGRSHEVYYGPRACDLDILLFRSHIITSETLVIPHQLMTERRFVLRPLCDLIPDALHPTLGKTMRALLAAVRDELNVRRYAGRLAETEPA